MHKYLSYCSYWVTIYNPQPCIQPPINEKFNDDSISKKINDYVVTDSSYSNYSSRGEDDTMDQTREAEKKLPLSTLDNPQLTSLVSNR